MKLLGYENIEIKKNPIRLLGESTDKLRLRILVSDYPSSAIISGMLYRGEYAKAYDRCVEVFGATHTFSQWCYDLVLQWERLTGVSERNPQQ